MQEKNKKKHVNEWRIIFKKTLQTEQLKNASTAK